ncbi:sterol desaturase family protein [Pseudovibrio sp. Tun.PSC04-5.I4]|uniref:sterol desaturase family protein n=1 Tax=Pseudovibrio sp. Tun.PSC04-5.I4 TaxID=1798213 RepID=UPI00088305D9|nr:sterol desaturase family protein [Pseudovibrio sp. Tun.PSC04-5.I4]SDQ76333.1 Sterol desaturase/sphingolipid hydroxylase, fatty acid hydroxylase superfamily [Pseudovibrio sp. Tun.PSC04-5.I4]
MADYNVTALAIPLFLSFMLVEYAYLRLNGRDLHRFNDNIASLSMGICLLVSDAFLKTFTFSVFIWVWSFHRLFDFSSTGWATWVLFFFGVDFCYYWFHRIAHTYNVLWGAHVGHHQSEEYNLTTALRQSAFQYAFSWVFYLPLAVLGCPPEVFLIQFFVLKGYQFWLHTQAINRIPLMEGVFSTPSSHRVHHAKNPIYIDKNYGGTLVIWDRLFGSWQPELDAQPCHYGTTTPLKTWNPVTANLQHWSMLFRDSVHTQSWWDKIRLWFKPTGWRPEDRRRTASKLQKTGTKDRAKFNPSISAATRLYCGLSFVLLILLVTMFIFLSPQLNGAQLVFGVALILSGLVVISQFLEGRFRLKAVEVIRIPALLWFLAVLWSLPISTQVSQRLAAPHDISAQMQLPKETTLSALPWLEKPEFLSGSTPAVQQLRYVPSGDQGQIEYTLTYELSSFPQHVANILSARSKVEQSSRQWLEDQL